MTAALDIGLRIATGNVRGDRAVDILEIIKTELPGACYRAVDRCGRIVHIGFIPTALGHCKLGCRACRGHHYDLREVSVLFCLRFIFRCVVLIGD